MKKNLIVLALASVAILAGTSKTNAQLVSRSRSLEYQKDLIGEQNNISPKAIRGFNKAYGDGNNESWDYMKDGFAARFSSHGVRNTIFYDKKGNWAGSIKLYSEDKLLRQVRHLVKSEYYDYKIVYAEEIETIDSPGLPTYIVCLEDKTKIKMVRIFDGDMKVWKDYRKAD